MGLLYVSKQAVRTDRNLYSKKLVESQEGSSVWGVWIEGKP